MEEYDYIYNILVVGDSGVGKTNFLYEYVENKFLKINLPTFGIDDKNKLTELPNGKLVKLKIWDTPGAERFRNITKQFYKGAHGIILLYDVTNESSFKNVNNWIKYIREYTQSNVVIYLIGTKIDAIEERKVKKEEGEKIAKELRIPFAEASSKTGYNVNEIFQDFIGRIYKIRDVNICEANESAGKKLLKFIDY